MPRVAFLAPLVIWLAQPPQTSVFVDTAWLADRLTDPAIVVLHVGSANSYAAAHIAGARLMSAESFTTNRDGATMEMPDAAAFASALEATGITDESHVVLYATSNPPTLAARLWVTLERFGFAGRASILDGGLPAWTREGRLTSTETPAPARGAVTLDARENIVVDHTFVRARILDGGATVIDARATPFWSGERFNSARAARPGRVAGAVNLPYSAVVDSAGRLLERASLQSLFASAGVAADRTIVTYCHIGQQASLVHAVARHLGLAARLYDGSYEDWSRRTELPVDTGGVRH